MRTIAFHNLGCKVNSYETDAMAQKCVEKGYKIVDFEQKADIYVVNTCSVTNIADRKSRQMLHKAKKTNPDGIVVAVGCFVQANPEEVAKDEAIDLIVGNNKKKDLFEIIEEYLNNKSVSTETVTDVHHCDYEELKINKSEEHSRVFVKIQDGCDRYCTYCIIPYVRGNLRSRNPEDVVEEIKEIAANGYREVVITGIHLSSYGKDFLKDGKPSLDYSGNADYLINLLKDINEIEGIDRIRIGSFEPMILYEVFVSKLSKITKLCPHFHISLQSGCDSVLKRMNRHYDTKEFYEKTVLLREYFPGCALTTDVIAGFPGETKEEFEETYEYLKKIKFFETHIFPYSRRKGTIADKMAGQLTMNEKKERVSKLLDLDAKRSREYRESKLGETDNIIVEEIKTINGANYYVGHTPEYVMVALKEDDSLKQLIGHTVKVKLEKMLTDEVVFGKIEL
ncbi:MAG: tRNA (N(6)-L-threonylcarbamoyladenosine(37)-C(2))-methylthiotransferase MtaB [Lachnospiraceae bacterium]|nr:tRNA (N(6)-L-threonylcarbamoyladenosine(37)-C(2))-methylthiotransferase MtaB [Lachnospiraceae bacterium]